MRWEEKGVGSRGERKRKKLRKGREKEKEKEKRNGKKEMKNKYNICGVEQNLMETW